MELGLSIDDSKEAVFGKVSDYLAKQALRYVSSDTQRPWGGFFVIDEAQTEDFVDKYFPEYPKQQINQYGNKLSPKILVVEPGKRLSWQYHNRRAELWRTLKGPVGVITSDDDCQGPLRQLNEGDTIQFDSEIRHRLIGSDNWGVVAEIWQHTDTNNPSNEEDIVRLEDDFHRP